MRRDGTGPDIRVKAADTQAAEWHARLGKRQVSQAELEAFFAWRDDANNADAYRRVERIWEGSAGLDGDPRINAALREALNRRTGRAGYALWPDPRFGLAAAAVAAVLAVGAWSWLQTRDVVSTAVGEQRVIQLADGSSIRLDTDTRVRVRFDGHQRRVDLETGQALFSVAHDPARPFVVDAGLARVTAVGTVFDVRREVGDVSVTLVSGLVDVAANGEARPAPMAAGHRTRANRSGMTTSPVDVALATSWTDGRIMFRDTSLDEAVAEVNRYLTAKVELAEGPSTAVPISGVFRAGDRDAFVSAVSQGLGMQVHAGARGAIVLSEPTGN